MRSSQIRRGALAGLAAIELPATASEAQLLHAVLEAGLRAVDQRVAEVSYAAEAAEQRAEDTERRAIARRRRPAWADEES